MPYQIKNIKYDKIRNAMAVSCKYIDEINREYTYYFFVKLLEDDTNYEIQQKIEYGIEKIREILSNITNNNILIEYFIVYGDPKKNKYSISMEVMKHNDPRKRAILEYKDKNQLESDINKTISFFEQVRTKDKMNNKIKNFKFFIGL